MDEMAHSSDLIGVQAQPGSSSGVVAPFASHVSLNKMILSQQQKLIDMNSLKSCRIDPVTIKQESGLLASGYTTSPAISSPTPSNGNLESDKDISNHSEHVAPPVYPPQVRINDGQMALLLPDHYIQLATALGLNTQPIVEHTPAPPATDFESLIEQNRRHAAMHEKMTADILANLHSLPENVDENYWELYKKSLGIPDSISKMTLEDVRTLMAKSAPKPPTPPPVTKMEVDDPVDEKPFSVTDVGDGENDCSNHSIKKETDPVSPQASISHEATEDKQRDDSDNPAGPSSSYENISSNEGPSHDQHNDGSSDDSMWRPW
ncbi:uncharacterized protein LOC110681472 [Aedes aegypti]|uniref:Uncharacterized protein n=1 Tax=Aedes aegypti TaxID=7159 RepID=A0A903VAL5_AEDAE|nr:uncharacterized protein LOC110681472 [Aedes aegypti]